MNLDRLHKLQAENTIKGLEMDLEAGRFRALASRHEDGTAPRAVSSFNLFQTPPKVAAHMVELARDIAPDAKTILEPSAGLGRIFLPAWAAWGESGHFCLVEQSRDCMAELYRMTEGKDGCRLRQGDFLLMDDLGLFDLVLMNPPFKQGRDIKHIRKALTMLREGGALLTLCYNGVKQNKILKPVASHWEVLPEGSFKQEGTRASVALAIFRT